MRRFSRSEYALGAAVLLGTILHGANPAVVRGGPPDSTPSQLGALLEKQGYIPVPLLRCVTVDEYRPKVFLVHLTINRKKLLLCIDTGAQYGIYLRLPALQKVGINLDGVVLANASAFYITETRIRVGLVDGISFENSPYVVDGPLPVDYVGGMNADESYVDLRTGVAKVEPLDGLVGMKFLQEHSAVIDCESGTMYLMPRVKRLLPLWGGRWVCTGGVKDGQPITDAGTRSLFVRDDLTVEITAIGQSWRGSLHPTRYGQRDLFQVFMKNPDGQSYTGIEGIYRLKGDDLTLCVADAAARTAPVARVHKGLPTEFSAAEGSGYVVFHFQRKSVKLPADPPKK